MAKRTHTNRSRTKWKPGAVLQQPQSPAGVMRSKKGKAVNLGLNEPAAPSWRSAPFQGTFVTPKIAS